MEGGGDKEFGERDEDDPGGKLIGTHFRAHLHQTNPPIRLFMSAVPAFFSLFLSFRPFSGSLCLSFCLPLTLSEELSLPRPPRLLSDGRPATVLINTAFWRPGVRTQTAAPWASASLRLCGAVTQPALLKAPSGGCLPLSDSVGLSEEVPDRTAAMFGSSCRHVSPRTVRTTLSLTVSPDFIVYTTGHYSPHSRGLRLQQLAFNLITSVYCMQKVGFWFCGDPLNL